MLSLLFRKNVKLHYNSALFYHFLHYFSAMTQAVYVVWDGKTFEVGGKNKKQKQIQDAAQGYIVKDDIETSYGNVIPLWQFGLTY